jgi:autotransporter-associated beta strand protein
MKTPILAAIRCSLIFLVSAVAYAGSAQWNLNPTSGDWNAADNWTPMTVPNGPADIATFALSNTTFVSLSANTEVNEIAFTAAATNAYVIDTGDFGLTFSGTGIVNNSGFTQNFWTEAQGFGPAEIVFTNSATAGTDVSIFNIPGSTFFLNNSTAGGASIQNDLGNIIFFDASSAGNASIFVEDVAIVGFANISTAASAALRARGDIIFTDSSNADSATISSAGRISFYGSSTGGTAQIELFSVPYELQGTLDISAHNVPGMTIGSLEGDETATVFLGANNLTVGSKNLGTTFSGVIQDGGEGGGMGGSLTKIGTEALDLTGTNTYTGNTTINGGGLQVDGSITSDTFVNRGGRLAGTGTINGNVTNGHKGTVSPGGTLGMPGTLTVSNNYTQMPSATFLIQIGGADASQISVLDVHGNANLKGSLNPMLVNGFVPEVGQTFQFMNYASFTGFFSHIVNHVFDHGKKRWAVAYDPTGAVLSVVKNGR